VYRRAVALDLRGFVVNTPQGVTIEAEGDKVTVTTFLASIEAEKPSLSTIETLKIEWIDPVGDPEFLISESLSSGDMNALVLPDIAPCADCLREIRDPADRRFAYPFTNCTHCGPRFTIIHRLPYDRPNTAMSGFALCADCLREYHDPRDRRFHAQPVACPACGPQLQLWDGEGRVKTHREDALLAAAKLLSEGKILALKGLGGFHLLCVARNADAIRLLRERKGRKKKPFALLYASLDQIRKDCDLSTDEERLLASPECPIVLVQRKVATTVEADHVAPDTSRLGVMLPPTPLHHLLMDIVRFPLVATSGNLSEEPICTDVRHMDDSIVQVVMGREMILRRARGYAPLPITVEDTGGEVLAVGGHLKNTTAMAKGGRVWLSQHMGDLETVKAFEAFQEATQEAFQEATKARQTLY
jgi:hydrogenase maturation protein HypF